MKEEKQYILHDNLYIYIYIINKLLMKKLYIK